MSNILKVRKVSALPATLEASTMYMVATTDPLLFDCYVSSADGSASKHIINKPDVVKLINDAIASFSALEVVNDIAARDGLNPTKTTQVLVLDATGDTTVKGGSATYVYNINTTSWYKISESESLDIVFNWASLINKPTSAVEDIDDAVNKRHTHTNKAVLDDLSDTSGLLYYKTVPIRPYLDQEDW